MTTIEKLFALVQDSPENATTIAKKVGLSVSIFPEWKRGKMNPSIDALIKLADYFDVSLDWLCGRTEARVMGNPPTYTPARRKLHEMIEELPCASIGVAEAYLTGLLSRNV